MVLHPFSFGEIRGGHAVLIDIQVLFIVIAENTKAACRVDESASV